MYIYIIYLENALRTWQLTKNVLSMDINNWVSKFTGI
jgi:hypothetical protein